MTDVGLGSSAATGVLVGGNLAAIRAGAGLPSGEGTILFLVHKRGTGWVSAGASRSSCSDYPHVEADRSRRGLGGRMNE